MVLPGKGMSWKEFFVALKKEYKRDKLADVAGSVTFFALLATFPFLLCLVSLASLIIDPAQAQSLIEQLAQVAPKQAMDILSERIRELGAKESGGVFTFALVGAIWAASGGVAALMKALNTVYGVEEGRPFWKVRGIAIGMTLFGAVLAIVAAVVAVATPAIADQLPSPFGTVLTWLRMPLAAALMMLLWAVYYYVLPDVQQKFKFITPGSVIGVVIWAFASFGFSKYVEHFGKYDATYGALGGLIVMLLWMWISAQVVLIGAEINGILEHKSPEGKKVGAKSMKDKGPSETKTEKEERVGEKLPGNVAPPGKVAPGVPAHAATARAPRWRSPHTHKAKPSLAWLLLASLFERRNRRKQAHA